MPKVNSWFYAVLIGRTPANKSLTNFETRTNKKKELLNSNDKLVIYIDGYYKNNNKGCFAGIGIYYEDGSKHITELLPEKLQTKNRAELYAAVRAIETYKNQERVIKNKN
ncbi:ribonuclease HI [Gigaspora margarita]|uniref:Ribonuclease HI n=1 Tax=Gigaspora margarita TaxID=4874 RepID=A0A8H4A1W2_GIGMA|nr:ribonuclease HI [Gigaspora margarita]